MKGLFTKSFIRALIITAVAALIIVGGVYAYETLWSGKAAITIEPPTGEAQLEITGISTSDSGSGIYGGTYGTWDEASKTWTVSLPRGTSATLRMSLKNTGGDIVEIQKCVGDICFDAAHSVEVAPGVMITVSGYNSIAAGETGPVQFDIHAAADAEPGILPEVQLEIRQV